MKNKVSLSVIIPLYNMEDTIYRTLSTLICQIEDGDDIEIICIDDCSTDNTLEIIRGYREIEIITLNKRVTTGECRNIGIEKASKEFMCFLDGDDLIHLSAVRSLIANMNNADIGIATYNKYDYRDNKIISKNHGIHFKMDVDTKEIDTKDLYSNLYQITNSACWNKIFRSEYIKDNNIRFSDCVYAEDMCFMNSALTLSNKIRFIKECMIVYTVPSSNPKSNDRNSIHTWTDLFKSLKVVHNTIKSIRHKVSDEDYNKLIYSLLADCVGNIVYQNKKFKETNIEFSDKALKLMDIMDEEIAESLKDIKK